MLKAEVFKTIIKHVLMYGSETRALRKACHLLLEIMEIRMLRWVMGRNRIE